MRWSSEGIQEEKTTWQGRQVDLVLGTLSLSWWGHLGGGPSYTGKVSLKLGEGLLRNCDVCSHVSLCPSGAQMTRV